MPKGYYYKTVRGSTGTAVENADVTVSNPDGSEATVEDSEGNTLTQPLSTNAKGEFSFYAEYGTYTVEVTFDTETVTLPEQYVGPNKQFVLDNAGASELASLNQAFEQDETVTLMLSEARWVPTVTVAREVDQSGRTTDALSPSASRYEQLDYALAEGVTPSGTTGTITLTLDSSNWPATAEGKQVSGNGGRATITATDGTGVADATVDSDFTDTSTIASGDWSLYALQIGNTIELNSFIEGAPIELSESTYTGNSLDVSANNLAIKGVSMSPEGDILLTINSSDQEIRRYDLSTPYDLSTASDSGDVQSLGMSNNPFGLAVSPDGTELAFVNNGDGSITRYTMATAWDIANAVYESNQDLSAQLDSTGGPTEVSFSPDGSKLYIVDGDGVIHQYSLSTAYNVDTLTYDSVTFDFTSQVSGDGDGFVLSGDGTKGFLSDRDNGVIYQYSLGTANDLSSMTYDSISFDTSGEETNPTGISIVDQTKMYVCGFGSDAVFQYTLGGGSAEVYPIGGTKVLGDIDTASSTGSTYNISNLTGMSVKPDGTSVIIADSANQQFSQLVVNDPWDLSTITESGRVNFDHSANITSEIFGLAVSDDGTVLMAQTNTDVYQYSLGTAWDLSTASFVQSASHSSDTASFTRGMTVGDSGNKMFIVDFSDDVVISYSMSTAWDLSTRTIDQAELDVGTEENSPEGIEFSPNGKKVFIWGSDNGLIFQYDLSTPWDLSTESYNGINYDPGIAASSSNYSFSFSIEYEKMWMVEKANRNIVEFNIGTTIKGSAFFPAITTADGQLVTDFWTALNSFATTETTGTDALFYAFSLDGGSLWKIAQDPDGVRDVVRDNSGTWEINVATSFTGTTWQAASTNTVLDALVEAMDTEALNRMDKAQLEAADAVLPAPTETLNFAVIVQSGESDETPVFESATVNYDAEPGYEYAVLGTDYDVAQPNDDRVEVTALVADTYRVKVV